MHLAVLTFCQNNSSIHHRPFWTLCRTRRRPAAPSLVSSGSDSTRPSWWLTRWMFTHALLSLMHLGTSGHQTGECNKRKSFISVPGCDSVLQHHKAVMLRILRCSLSLSPSALEFLRLLKPVVFIQEQRSCCSSRTTARSLPLRTESKVKLLRLLQQWNKNSQRSFWLMHHSPWRQPVVSLSEVVTKYSNFVSFPIFLNGRRLNTLQVSRSGSVC